MIINRDRFKVESVSFYSDLLMSKLTALAIGLLAVIAIAPKSQAMSATVDPISVKQPAANLQSQLIIKIGGQSEYSDREELHRRRRYWEIHREREAARRRHEYYSRRYRDRDGYYDRDRGEFRVEYRGGYRHDH
jgi:hypothetical protein